MAMSELMLTPGSLYLPKRSISCNVAPELLEAKWPEREKKALQKITNAKAGNCTIHLKPLHCYGSFVSLFLYKSKLQSHNQRVQGAMTLVCA